MIAFAVYSLKVIACSAIFSAYYWGVLRKGRFHQWNRFYLLTSVALSLLIPLISIPVNAGDGSTTVLSSLSFTLDQLIVSAESMTTQLSGIPWEQVLFAFYCLIIIVLLSVAVRALNDIQRIRKSAAKQNISGTTIYVSDEIQSPFSFFSGIFWKSDIPLASEDGKSILQHELVHVKEKHSIDLLLMQLACIAFWFNPLFWLMKRELVMVHEFIADSSIKENDAQRLSKLILLSVYPQHYLQLTNQFFQTPIKRRLAMITNRNKINFSTLRMLMTMPLTAIILCVCSISQTSYAQQKTEKKQEVKPVEQAAVNKDVNPIEYTLVEVKPTFQGKDANTFATWVNGQITYPKEAQAKKIEGKVIVQFTISKTGELTDIKVLRSIDPLLDAEAIRVIKMSPKWEPGKLTGEAIDVIYTFPMKFSLK